MQSSLGSPAYRWIIVAASSVVLAISMGAIVNGMSAFVVPMQQAFGWARADVALINVAGIVGLAFGGILMGHLADRMGTRPVVLFGATVLGLCYLAAAYVGTLWQYYALMFLAGSLGASAIFAPVLAAVGRWFPVGAGLAIGIVSAGQAIGQGGVPFASSFMIRNLGIDGALGLTGGIMLAVLVPLSLLIRHPPRDSGSRLSVDNGSNGSYPPAVLVIPAMSAAVLMCCTCMSVPLMHLVPLVQDRGFQPEEASSVIFLMLVVAITGRIAFGRLADRIGALPAYMTATAWMTVMVYGFSVLDSLGGFYAYAAIYGFGYSGVMTGVLVSITMLTAPHQRATALGIITMFGWFGHASGGYLGGALFDLTGDYSAAYALAAAAGVANLIVVGLLYLKIRGPHGRPAFA